MGVNIELKSIGELNGMNFKIPSYQRGYRWTEQQVKDLLDDIEEFDQTKDGNFYCLQPLVVKSYNSEGNKYVVIDGQQRLTTIYLILQYLENKNFFNLKFERDSYIEYIDEVEFGDIPDRGENQKKKIDNVEMYHLFCAKAVIHNWFYGKKSKNVTKDDYLNKLNNDTKFIWYHVDNSEDEHRLFRNLNSGKIELTNAELIKALFLNNVGSDIVGREVRQNLIAEEFDQIERALREDDFWYFIAGKKEKPSSCIGLLFDLILETSGKSDKYTDKDFRTFFYFKDIILHNKEGERLSEVESYKQMLNVWDDVRKYYHTLEGWYKDSKMYNLIGYLRALKQPIELKEIYSLYTRCNNKQKFIFELKQVCKEKIKYDQDKYLELTYHDPEITNLLLLFNIATILNNTNTSNRFSFKDFHKYEWDKEHISPQNSKDIKKFIENYSDDFPDQEDLEILKSINNDNLSEKQRNTLHKYFTEDVDLLENMTLLTSHDNRGIGNKFYYEKRDALITYFNEGSFIPPCSMNVFLKFYTEKPKQIYFWDDDDRKSYIDKLKEIISKFFNGGIKL
jgi:hypothetical protein